MFMYSVYVRKYITYLHMLCMYVHVYMCTYIHTLCISMYKCGTTYVCGYNLSVNKSTIPQEPWNDPTINPNVQRVEENKKDDPTNIRPPSPTGHHPDNVPKVCNYIHTYITCTYVCATCMYVVSLFLLYIMV